jgi:hypothetical protein
VLQRLQSSTTVAMFMDNLVRETSEGSNEDSISHHGISISFAYSKPTVSLSSNKFSSFLLTTPMELLFKIFYYNGYKSNTRLSLSNRELYDLFQNRFVKRTKKYILKDYNEINSLIVILQRSDVLETIMLDCRNRGLLIASHPLDGNAGMSDNNGTNQGNKKAALSSVKKIEDEHLSYLSLKNRCNLTTLVLKGCTSLTSTGYSYIAASCQHLQTLDLSYLPNLSALSLNAILLQNKRLSYLTLEKSYNAVSNETLQTLSRSCRYLRTLSLSYCSSVGDYGVICLSEGCRHLKELSLAHCYDISSEAFCLLFERCKEIAVISLECKFDPTICCLYLFFLDSLLSVF